MGCRNTYGMCMHLNCIFTWNINGVYLFYLASKHCREVTKDANTSNSLNYSDVRDSTDRTPPSTLWNYWNNAANLLKTSIYQLSPTTVSPTKQTTGKELLGKNYGPGCSDSAGASEVFKSLSTAKLTRYVTNLRMWISATILQRLVKEFDKIDSEFASRGFSDIKIGSVGIERLKKTVENHMVASYVPTLAKVIPFLDMTSNQEYLVRRIRELAKGSGINDYRWNSSNAYDSNWDEHVTTDAAVIFIYIQFFVVFAPTYNRGTLLSGQFLIFLYISFPIRSYSICFAHMWIVN